MNSFQLGVIGAKGKMGQSVISCAHQDPSWNYVWGLVQEKSNIIAPLYHDPKILPKVDVIIDFSSATALTRNVQIALQTKTPLVIGSTGLSQEQLSYLQKQSTSIPLFVSSNFSLGMAAMQKAVQLLSSLLPTTTCHIQETHHCHKKDQPSGSALALQRAAKAHPNLSIDSIRKGEIIGQHVVYFLGEEEKLHLQHEALSRDLFAKGALQAARFLLSRPPGLYHMDHLLDSSQHPLS